MRIILPILLVFGLSFAVDVTQTDWFGGDGVPGPVTDWSNNYDISTDIDSSGGTLQLNEIVLDDPVKNIADDNYEWAFSICAADIDGDSDVDIMAGSIHNDIGWWENSNGSGTAWIGHTISGRAAYSIRADDVDGDGDTDVLGACYNYDSISWWENADGLGGSWVEHTIDGTFDGAYSAYSSDVDGDNDIDVLGAALQDDEIAWWENIDGSGNSWSKHIVSANVDGAHSVFAADIDGDGDTDVLGAARDADKIIWWENTNGSGTAWSEILIDGSCGSAQSVFATDMDADNDIDVLCTSLSSDEIAWWENINGTGTTWAKHTVGGFPFVRSACATDTDGDGDMDVLASSSNKGIAWWENTDGTGTLWVEHTIDDSFSEAWAICAADMDSDGYMDAVAPARNISDIAWWDLFGYFEGTLESSILNAGPVSTWNTFESNYIDPTNTSVGFQFRSSSDSSSMGVWSDTVFSTTTSLAGILADSTKYLQYKVILETSDHMTTPVLQDVAFSYSILVHIDERSSCEITSWGLFPLENPSRECCFSAQIAVPESGTVELALYDITGRVVAESLQEFSAGLYSVCFQRLNPGVYYCVMKTEEFLTSERVVVLK